MYAVIIAILSLNLRLWLVNNKSIFGLSIRYTNILYKQLIIKYHDDNQLIKKQNYSYLGVVAGLCCEADYIFVPEDPPKKDWPERLCQQLSQARKSHQYSIESFIII